jgi:hypothetical protein
LRPPGVAEPSKHRIFTPAQRRKQAARMKPFWAAKRKAAGRTAKVTAPAASAAKRERMSAEQKKALSVKMKASWAKRKKAAA